MQINKPTDKYITLARDSVSGTNNKIIHNSGQYQYTTAQFKDATSSYYYGSYYDEEIGIQNESGTTLNISETVISLKNSKCNKYFIC